MAGTTITAHPALARLGIEAENSGVYGRDRADGAGGGTIASVNPADGRELARVRLASAQPVLQSGSDVDQDVLVLFR